MPSVPNSGSAVPPPPPVWDAPPPEARLRYAGFWIRVVAAIVDGIALGILSQIVNFFIPAPPPPPDNPDLDMLMAYLTAALSPTVLIVDAIIAWAYFALQESSSAQATVGKRLLGIRVSNQDGGRLSLGAASIRAWPFYIPTLALLATPRLGGLVALLTFISYVSVAFSAQKRGLHDKMAGAILTRD